MPSSPREPRLPPWDSKIPLARTWQSPPGGRSCRFWFVFFLIIFIFYWFLHFPVTDSVKLKSFLHNPWPLLYVSLFKGRTRRLGMGFMPQIFLFLVFFLSFFVNMSFLLEYKVFNPLCEIPSVAQVCFTREWRWEELPNLTCQRPKTPFSILPLAQPLKKKTTKMEKKYEKLFF